MNTFIKKIFEGKTDNYVHIQFQKFSKGEFRDKALVNVTKTKEKYSISTTYEYANDFVRGLAEKIPNNQKVHVTGILVSTRNLSQEDLEFKDKKQFMGVKQYIIDSNLSKEEILNICNKFPNSFIGFSFSVGDTELKIKPKAPKSAKPSTSEKKATPDFCKIKTQDISIVRSVLFDVSDFKKVEVVHDFIINDLIIPKDEKDPLKMRENTIRKGKIIRKVNVDGKVITNESLFQA